ncbi:hypothetical protein CEXT_109751 [Caerostris extrusa]|uniref:Uncharacterized protein n=1 Tax=Caerostris extrusa TaxID=172846 RepID=A0AAV4QV14_CAEEX|nr:hypothetical protein CEXT_109751 [Caerostris extrusa]
MIRSAKRKDSSQLNNCRLLFATTFFHLEKGGGHCCWQGSNPRMGDLANELRASVSPSIVYVHKGPACTDGG